MEGSSFPATTFPAVLGQSLGIDSNQALMLGAAALGLTIVLVSTLRRFRQTGAVAGAKTARGRTAPPGTAGHSVHDVEQVMLELDQLSRQIHVRIDTKMAELEALLREADRTILQLSRAARAGTFEPALDVTLAPEVPGDSSAAATNQDSARHQDAFRLADEGFSPVEIGKRIGRPAGEVELILSLRKVRSGVTSATGRA